MFNGSAKSIKRKKMKKQEMKKRVPCILSVILSVALSIAWCSSCDDLDSEADKGKKAAEEFCDCLDDGYTVSKCNEKFHSNYGNNFSNDFIEAFDKAGKKCDIKAYKD
jgi:hypothetical protein